MENGNFVKNKRVCEFITETGMDMTFAHLPAEYIFFAGKVFKATFGMYADKFPYRLNLEKNGLWLCLLSRHHQRPSYIYTILLDCTPSTKSPLE
jgi:hypothetical protein